MTPELQKFYNPEGRVDATTLVDCNSGNEERSDLLETLNELGLA
ncbi:hypothetical protein [Collimonas sp.]|nr:hypothetical protein [Collimonas sp.]HWW05585.1 hypothetical protein [Collimonas sp.]